MKQFVFHNKTSLDPTCILMEASDRGDAYKRLFERMLNSDNKIEWAQLTRQWTCWEIVTKI